jgi:tRNA(adenine34) deaminase
MDISEADRAFFERAITLAQDAEQQGNLPVGAVIVHDGNIIAEGQNAIWQPTFNPSRHAEIEALRHVPAHLWEKSMQMTLYTTLEPCLMCLGAILLHRIGRVLYGSADYFGGANLVIGNMPTAFELQIAKTEWLGPVYPAGCDPLFARLRILGDQRRARQA